MFTKGMSSYTAIFNLINRRLTELVASEDDMRKL